MDITVQPTNCETLAVVGTYANRTKTVLLGESKCETVTAAREEVLADEKVQRLIDYHEREDNRR